MRFLLLVTVSFLWLTSAYGQTLRVGFYNVENLYDTINDPNVDDGDFTPQGRKRWSSTKYFTKLTHLNEAIALFSPDILGLCEVENRAVLRDLTRRTKNLRGIVHYDSHDSRGIDVALIFDATKLKLINSEPIFIKPMRRNVLRAEIKTLHADTLVIFVVHLPSKLGGEGAARRRANALLSIDSLVRLEAKNRKVMVIGDFNDSPREVGSLINCAIVPHNQGVGSYAYRDVWDMIDQILISRSMRDMCTTKQTVVCQKELIQQTGRFRGYPRKGIISDHLPIYIDLKLE